MVSNSRVADLIVIDPVVLIVWKIFRNCPPAACQVVVDTQEQKQHQQNDHQGPQQLRLDVVKKLYEQTRQFHHSSEPSCSKNADYAEASTRLAQTDHGLPLKSGEEEDRPIQSDNDTVKVKQDCKYLLAMRDGLISTTPSQ